MSGETFPLKYGRPEIPVIDLDRFRNGTMTQKEMTDATLAFATLGVVCLRDSRVTPEMQRNFRNTMKRIHGASAEELRLLDGADTGFQRGMTPPFTECPLDHSEWVKTLRPEHRPLTEPGRADPKARFMWPIGPRPKQSRWPKVNPHSAVPPRFADIASPLDMWGNCMLNAGHDLLEVVALGLGMPQRRFSRMLANAPHILGPTGSNFTNAVLGTVLAGLHYDFNVVTIHGQTEIRALICWTCDGEPFLVEVPDGCLLAQVGKELEYLTGGYFFAGMHEVDVTPESLKDAAAMMARGEVPIRASSNLFMHLGTRNVLMPMGRFATPEALLKYPPVYVGDYETRELVQIGLFPAEDLVACSRVPPQFRRRMAQLTNTPA